MIMPIERETMAISRFKATCLAVLERVRRTGRPVVVTRFGEPIAEVVPPRQPAAGADWLGSESGRVRIVGDIITPAADEGDWEVLGR